MDLTHVIARIASDCDLRNRFVQSAPGIFDNYFVVGDEIVTGEELNRRSSFRYFLDGLNFVAGQVRA